MYVLFVSDLVSNPYSIAALTRGRAGKVGPSAKMGPSVTAFLECSAVKATVVVLKDPPVDKIQRRICFFAVNAKR